MIRDPAELCRLLDLPLSVAAFAPEDYPLLVSRSFLDRMEKGNPNDPLLLQILPNPEETHEVAGFGRDPLGERDFLGTRRNHSPFPMEGRTLKKYPGRILLLTTERCALHCRFCFRRHFDRAADSNDRDTKDFERILFPIRSDPTCEEVILSGGDPLMLADAQLERLIYYIGKIPHVKRLRLHSRVPIALPERITLELGDLLRTFSPTYLVLHVNHPNELDASVVAALGRLCGVVLLSQTVLLKGINDDEEVLIRLFSRLADLGVVPYYLHQLDKVQGAAHFEVDPQAGRRLLRRLRESLPGYAVPKYVRETPDSPCKRDV